jgi:transposase-like protein
LIRNGLRYVPWKDSKAVVADLKPIYQATTLAEAEVALETFAAQWQESVPYPIPVPP